MKTLSLIIVLAVLFWVFRYSEIMALIGFFVMGFVIKFLLKARL